MSTRRFVAYFLAVAAGSTVAFAPALLGRPAPPMKDAEVILTPTDVGLDMLPPEAVRLYQAMRDRPHRRPAPRAAQVALLKPGGF